ncbi:3-deoxy-manno-octulosonate cytidylyltransferase [Thiohalomonas denitrificans]|uniref:3-deoxy-manno-octulosonate cytidylyltransferase n=1 Tax=Thiohalomonas denitrificans TaxID=415747 RepID=A0A1G5R378_9GAMM|nr:3-deoxy-manno-octulosonate cytidylyltransferase [Thiohalomonas denitrificans]SCZ67779.1 3-deoxy-manno-octulosonate cytidylyltransferase (CMP-KDO synthetase) [Thiohalomonas denitrificans]
MFRVFIPARYASQRLPGKPLLPIAGRPMLQHVYERAVASGAAQVIVVTDDERIADAVMGFGGEVLMTGAHHRSGTERIAEAVSALGLDSSEVVVNLQGDEPLMPADLIRQVAEDLECLPTADIATLATRIHTAGELFDPHAVKVVMDKDGFALYFSRAVIPWDREAFAVTTEELPPAAEHYRHLGLYAYRAGFLSRYVDLPPCSIESMESLEQLRVLWHGGRIHVAEAITQPGPGVDTEADLNRVRKLLEV